MDTYLIFGKLLLCDSLTNNFQRVPTLKLLKAEVDNPFTPTQIKERFFEVCSQARQLLRDLSYQILYVRPSAAERHGATHQHLRCFDIGERNSLFNFSDEKPLISLMKASLYFREENNCVIVVVATR